MVEPRVTEVSLSLASVIAASKSNSDSGYIKHIARFLSEGLGGSITSAWVSPIQVMYLTNVYSVVRFGRGFSGVGKLTPSLVSTGRGQMHPLFFAKKKEAVEITTTSCEI
jgi:hypothetical protein